jgi:invasion protein IalB
MTAEASDPYPVDLNWRRCLPGGCFADVEIKDEVLERWRGLGNPGAILFKDSTGRDISVPFLPLRPTPGARCAGEELIRT